MWLDPETQMLSLGLTNCPPLAALLFPVLFNLRLLSLHVGILGHCSIDLSTSFPVVLIKVSGLMCVCSDWPSLGHMLT